MHHEKLDGSGYPNGAKASEIPVQSRILAIADSFDAMTSERPYRAPLDERFAAGELINCSGSQFDPEIVDVFIKKVLKIS
jgi:HD-GYP domain-containing protein (c-di-GMP phosphodiesterase class II)